MNETGRCETCRHCDMGRGPRVHSLMCLSPKLRYAYGNDGAEDELCYMDYEEYKAELWVGPRFGCVHWEARPEKEGKP